MNSALIGSMAARVVGVGERIASPPVAAQHQSGGLITENDPGLGHVVPDDVTVAPPTLVERVGIGCIPRQARSARWFQCWS